MRTTISNRSISSIIRARQTIGRRRKELSKRKNIFPALFFNGCLWILLGLFIFSTDPARGYALPVFFVLLFINTFFLASLLLINVRRGLLVATGLTIFLVLRIMGIGNIINAALLIGVITTFEIYFSSRN